MNWWSDVATPFNWSCLVSTDTTRNIVWTTSSQDSNLTWSFSRLHQGIHFGKEPACHAGLDWDYYVAHSLEAVLVLIRLLWYKPIMDRNVALWVPSRVHVQWLHKEASLQSSRWLSREGVENLCKTNPCKCNIWSVAWLPAPQGPETWTFSSSRGETRASSQP